MRTKLLILPVIMMMGLAVSAPVSADTTDPTRVEIVTQGGPEDSVALEPIPTGFAGT